VIEGVVEKGEIGLLEEVVAEDPADAIYQQQQQQRLIPLGGVGYMDQLPP